MSSNQGSTVAEWATRRSRLSPPISTRYVPQRSGNTGRSYSYRGQDFFAGENPPDGALIDYSSISQAAQDVRITVAESGRPRRRSTSLVLEKRALCIGCSGIFATSRRRWVAHSPKLRAVKKAAA